MFGVEEANALFVADVGFGRCAALVVFEFGDGEDIDLIFVYEVAGGRGHESFSLVPYCSTYDSAFRVWIFFGEVWEGEDALFFSVALRRG